MAKKILLADDSVTIQKVVELTFSDGAYHVQCVSNGKAAVQKIQEDRPDLLLCDVIMPEMNGYEVASFVKKNPTYSAIPVILLTGTFEPFDEDKARLSGADAYVTKPFDSRMLVDKVEDLLRQRVAFDASLGTEPVQVFQNRTEFTISGSQPKAFEPLLEAPAAQHEGADEPLPPEEASPFLDAGGPEISALSPAGSPAAPEEDAFKASGGPLDLHDVFSSDLASVGEVEPSEVSPIKATVVSPKETTWELPSAELTGPEILTDVPMEEPEIIPESSFEEILPAEAPLLVTEPVVGVSSLPKRVFDAWPEKPSGDGPKEAFPVEPLVVEPEEPPASVSGAEDWGPGQSLEPSGPSISALGAAEIQPEPELESVPTLADSQSTRLAGETEPLQVTALALPVEAEEAPSSDQTQPDLAFVAPDVELETALSPQAAPQEAVPAPAQILVPPPAQEAAAPAAPAFSREELGEEIKRVLSEMIPGEIAAAVERSMHELRDGALPAIVREHVSESAPAMMADEVAKGLPGAVRQAAAEMAPEHIQSVAREAAPAVVEEAVQKLAPSIIESMVRGLAPEVIRQVAWEVIPEMAESLIKRRIQELEAEAG